MVPSAFVPAVFEAATRKTRRLIRHHGECVQVGASAARKELGMKSP